ncbi:DUF917 family protein [Clostridium sp. WLY-B-L2]|uniref:DUF917 family protein n=1 Tax=Clostridium aromativorans TaxID=2836848 RepID=A0ABS8N916_9CLOT|nr:DUF917 family protein [Clostridium aromativorans]MCC9296293.1 DUF917 family protein [Clostridium aromativorans]
MGKIKIDNEVLNYAVFGGNILGGGGGGSRKVGMELGKAALGYGNIQMLDIDDIPEDRLIITCSAVGAPAANLQRMSPEDAIDAIKIFEQNVDKKIGGIITNENGGGSSINGWIQSAALDLPLVDAPCNGRAHPTGVMGSMGLNNIKDYVSCQTAVGGNPEINKHIEIFVKGSIENTSNMVRKASVCAGGLVAVVRNPVTVKYVKKNAALHGVKHAIELGKVFLKALGKNPCTAPEKTAEYLNGEIIADGRVDRIDLKTSGGFDTGKVRVGSFEITFWNEYMTLEKNGERLASFPDLIMTFDSNTGLPVTSAEIKKDQNVKILKTSRENLRLGSGMRDVNLITQAGEIVNKKIL